MRPAACVLPGRREAEPPARLFGIIRYDGPGRAAAEVVVAFPSAPEADQHAKDEGFGDYQVVPLAFIAEDPPRHGPTS